MRLITILSGFFICLNTLGFGQGAISVKGYLKDSLTNEPIANASMVFSRNKGVTTKDNGYFDFTVKSLPVVLSISHTSYGTQEVLLESVPEKGDLVIRLMPYTRQIREVQVSGERLRILTKNDDFSIGDMAFDHDHLWMIVYMNNMVSRSRLCLADHFGDTLKTIAIGNPAGFCRDVFGNVHLELKDSIYQLYSPDFQSINFIYGEDKEVFHQITDKFIAGFGNNLVSCRYNKNEESVVISYFNESKPGSYFLTQIADSLERVRKEMERKGKAGSMWLDLKRTRYWKRDTKIAQIYEGNVKAPMFSLNDTLFVLNAIKDSLLRYSPDGKWDGAVPVQFHKDTALLGTDDKNISFLTDNSTNSCYIVERQSAGWAINRLNLYTGKVEKRIPLPNYPGITRITVFKNAVYFLYDQKNYPYYVRLYRYQI